MVFQALNRLKWMDRLGMCEIVILHRGAPGDRKIISGRSLTEVKRTYFSYDSGREEVTVPLHRILEVRLDGKTVWEKKRST